MLAPIALITAIEWLLLAVLAVAAATLTGNTVPPCCSAASE